MKGKIPPNKEAYNAVKKHIENNISYNTKDLAKEIGVHPRTVKKYAAKARKELGMNVTIKDRRKNKVDRRKNKGGGGLKAFQNLYDDSTKIPKLIEDGIEKHLVDKDGEPDWMYDYAFREACGVSVTKWRRYADEFKRLQVKAGDEKIWGHPDIIDEMRRMLLK